MFLMIAVNPQLVKNEVYKNLRQCKFLNMKYFLILPWSIIWILLLKYNIFMFQFKESKEQRVKNLKKKRNLRVILLEIKLKTLKIFLKK